MSAENIFNSVPSNIIEAIKRNERGPESLEKVSETYYQVELHQQKVQEHLCKILICLGIGLASNAIVPGAGLFFIPEFARQFVLKERNLKKLSGLEIQYNQVLDNVLSLIPEEELDKLDY
ncbi:MAG TPA: hypothetical protein VLE44_00015 [Candidatus Saccharimonadales bacterium]|nr:hypothetical protein [Candidatus Saccharimonadales bacterium]